MKNEVLYRASLEFVKKATQIISESVEKNSITPIEFTSISSDLTQPNHMLFDELSRYEYDLKSLYDENQKRIEASTEFGNLIFLLEKYKTIKNHFDKKIIINSYDPNISLDANYLLKLMTVITLWRNQSFRVDKAIFDNIYREIINFFWSKSIANSLLIALEGFHCDLSEIEVEQNIHIIKYPLWRLLSIWYNESRTMKNELILPVKLSHFAIRITWHNKKYVNKSKISITPAHLSISRAGQLEGAAHQLISALKVFKEGSIGNGAVLPGVFFMDLLLDDAVALPTMHSINSYTLLKSEISKFKSFWKDYNRIHSKKPFNVAIKRFHYSLERWHDLEDRIIDYLIAFESLFLFDMGKEAHRGEKRFRLALRMSFFLSPNNTTKRKKIFREMKTAYDIRSAIVHGGDIKSELKSLKMQLSDFCDLIEGHLRNCLKRLIRDGKIPKWDDLIMECKK